MKRLAVLLSLFLVGCGPTCEKITGTHQVQLVKLPSKSPGCESAKISDTMTLDFGVDGKLKPASIGGEGSDMDCTSVQEGCGLKVWCNSTKGLVSVTLDFTVYEGQGQRFHGEMLTESHGGGECSTLVYSVTSL